MLQIPLSSWYTDMGITPTIEFILWKIMLTENSQFWLKSEGCYIPWPKHWKNTAASLMNGSCHKKAPFPEK